MRVRRNSSFFRRCDAIMKDMDKLPFKYDSFSDLKKGIIKKPEPNIDTFSKTSETSETSKRLKISELIYKTCECYFKY